MFVYLLLCRGGRSAPVAAAAEGRRVVGVPLPPPCCSTASFIRERTSVMCSRPVAVTTVAVTGTTAGAVAATDEGPESPNSQANLNRYRLHLYNYALQAERLRLTAGGWGAMCPVYPAAAAGIYPPRFPVALFHPGAGAGPNADEPKPQHSYIGLIAMAILGSTEGKLVLSDIYQYILDNYPYFRTRGPGWRNSIRHNLSLNDCFVKAGRSANGKGHYWAIHPANVDDFKKGDFRRRKAQRKVRRHMGLAVDDDGNDSPSPPPPPPPPPPPQSSLAAALSPAMWPPPPPQSVLGQQSPFYFQPIAAAAHPSSPPQPMLQLHQSGPVAPACRPLKRQFDVASLLAPDPPKKTHRDGPTKASASSDDEDDKQAVCNRMDGGGSGWEPILLQRYYEQQLQAAHRLHAFRQSLGLQRMIGAGGGGGGGSWPAFLMDRNSQTPSPSGPQPPYGCVTPDEPIKTELVD